MLTAARQQYSDDAVTEQNQILKQRQIRHCHRNLVMETSIESQQKHTETTGNGQNHVGSREVRPKSCEEEEQIGPKKNRGCRAMNSRKN
ncbi:hypothetical protein A2U01_0066986, partial [Trifolium medium]|nr:hypothetical protein [Trifolium medium]